MAQQNPLKRVLIVDDNREAADVLAEMLTLCGYDAIAAYDGPAGLDVAQRFAPDAILLDIGMPGMDGLAVASALRRQAKFGHTRVVAFTAWGDPQMRERTRRAGFDTHVVKPAALETIIMALAGSGIAALDDVGKEVAHSR